MDRRSFLALAGALTAAGYAGWPARAAEDPRLTWWDPATPTLGDGKFVVLEWRYLAGRITQGDEDFGFVVSLADYNDLPASSSNDRNELLVMRQELTAGGGHRTATYRGTLSYNSATATYSFVGEQQGVSASWRLDAAGKRYMLSVTAPELSLSQLLVAPIGELIPEGGTGAISSGSFFMQYGGVRQPVEALSDYFADWATLSLSGAQVGYGRLDMQTLRPRLTAETPEPYSHHWFALAAILDDGTEAYVSGWELLSGSTAWTVTIATGAGPSWKVSTVGSDTPIAFAGAQRIAVRILEHQPLPTSTPQHTGRRWRFEAGSRARGDLIDLDIAVQPGQFIKDARVSVASRTPMQEAVTTTARGLINGKGIAAVRFAVVESTLALPGAAPAPRTPIALPLLKA